MHSVPFQTAPAFESRLQWSSPAHHSTRRLSFTAGVFSDLIIALPCRYVASQVQSCWGAHHSRAFIITSANVLPGKPIHVPSCRCESWTFRARASVCLQWCHGPRGWNVTCFRAVFKSLNPTEWQWQGCELWCRRHLSHPFFFFLTKRYWRRFIKWIHSVWRITTSDK